MNEKKKGEFWLPPVPLWGPGMGMLPTPPIITDPNGSYTGRAVDGERPIQDADDL